MIEDMQLRGLAARTQEAYVAAVEQLANYYHKPPDEIGEEELRQYLLYLANEKVVSASTMTVALCGIKSSTSTHSSASGTCWTWRAPSKRRPCPRC